MGKCLVECGEQGFVKVLEKEQSGDARHDVSCQILASAPRVPLYQFSGFITEQGKEQEEEEMGWVIPGIEKEAARQEEPSLCPVALGCPETGKQ